MCCQHDNSVNDANSYGVDTMCSIRVAYFFVFNMTTQEDAQTPKCQPKKLIK